MKNNYRPGNRTWRIVYPSLAYYGINILVTAVFMTFLMAHLMLERNTTDVNLIMDEWVRLASQYNYEIAILIAIVAMPVMIFFFMRDRKREKVLGIYLKYDKVEPVYYLAAAFLGVSACITVNHLLDISGLTGMYLEALEEMEAALYQENLLIELIGVGLIVPAVEELVFRGLTMRRIAEDVGSTVSIFMSALLFACYHGNLLQGIYAFILGVLMGYVYDRYKTLAAPIVLHAAANTMSILVSETAILMPVYESDMLYMGATMLAAVLTLFAIGIIQYRVEPECLTKLPEDLPDGTENPDPDNIR